MLASLKKLAAACRVELSEQTEAVYLEDLAEYPDEALESGLRRARRTWMEPSKMPPIGWVRDVIEQEMRLAVQQRPLPDEPPPDDSTPEERAAFSEELRQRVAAVGRKGRRLQVCGRW